jgi:hypothetical protein
MATPKFLNLYRADNGADLGRIDLGDGLRGKTWADSLSQILQIAATSRTLTGDGYGVMTNFPAFLDGQKTRNRAFGENLSAALLNSVQLFRVVPQTSQLGPGDAAELVFGTKALTQPDPETADYILVDTATGGVEVPVGANAPAWLTGATVGGGYVCNATTGVLTLVVNGVTYDVTGLAGAAVSIANIEAACQAQGVPVRVYNMNTAAGNAVGIFTIGIGCTQNIRCIRTSAGAVIFAASAATLRYGRGGPLGQMDNTQGVAVKAQRRILPGTLSVTSTTAGALVCTCTDNRLTGVVTGVDTGAVVTAAGTLVYTTGALAITYSAAPAAAAITARYDALYPIDLREEVKMPFGGSALAILVS